MLCRRIGGIFLILMLYTLSIHIINRKIINLTWDDKYIRLLTVQLYGVSAISAFKRSMKASTLPFLTSRTNLPTNDGESFCEMGV